MGHTCIVRGCRSEWYPGCGMKFHLFPKDNVWRKRWLDIVPLKSKFYERAKICSLHFEETDYIGNNLRRTANPVIANTKSLDEIRIHLTAAERARCYSQKLKKDPERIQELRRKRMLLAKTRPNSKKTKISEISDEEKIQKRRYWRNRQRVHREKKIRIHQVALQEEQPNAEIKTLNKKVERKTRSGRPADSADIVKPVGFECCTLCRLRVQVNVPHKCTNTTSDKIAAVPMYECTGCKQNFSSIQLFNLHVSGLHCDGVESMFFPTTEDFDLWKTAMQCSTKQKYVNMSNITSKQMFQCAFFHGIQKTKSQVASSICPSTIVIREYSKGIQVHFYKNHYGHRHIPYVVPDKFKPYVITALMDQIEKTSKYELDVIDMFDDTDLYVQFKTLLDNIVLDAAKLKINHLKVLIGKALEMSTILKRYMDEEENFDECQKPAPIHKTMTDEQITSALESYTKDFKRKSTVLLDEPMDKISKIPIVSATKIDISNANIEKPKGIPMTPVKTYQGKRSKTPVILNTFSLADEQGNEQSVQMIKSENFIANDTKEVKFEEVESTPSKINPIPNWQVSSFNDSYKEFVDKNFVTKQEKKNENQPTNTAEKIKVLSKNDINERVENQMSINVNTNNNLIGENNSSDIQSNISLDSDEIPGNVIVNNIKKSKVNTRAYYNRKTSRNKIRILSNRKVKVKDSRKKVMKTKIGQFRPSLSPKKSEKIQRVRSSLNTSKSKADFEYEVKEQENDCNILILKI